MNGRAIAACTQSEDNKASLLPFAMKVMKKSFMRTQSVAWRQHYLGQHYLDHADPERCLGAKLLQS